ncbi:hypothetical protein BGZ82_011171 [Podila clonocystis]|nr:hypothetical protein BGZ82_011171 [Podila clonocystis]
MASAPSATNNNVDEEEIRLERQQEQDAFNQFQAQRRIIIEEDQEEEDENENEEEDEADDESTEENADATTSHKKSKTPFRSFKPRSRQAIALLKAMLLQSPFDKKNGQLVPDRWKKVVNLLVQNGEAELRTGNRNEFEHVSVRACRLAWERFKKDHQNHLQAQARLTGAVDNDEWEDLVHSVVELEEVEEDRKKAVLASKKRSAELLEQSNRDGAMLVEASLQRMSRTRNITSDSVSEDSGTERGRPRPRRERQQEVQQQMVEFLQYAKDRIANSAQRQEDRDNNLKEAFQASQQQTANLLQHVLENQAQASIMQVEASNKQTQVMEALLALLSKK